MFRTNEHAARLLECKSLHRTEDVCSSPPDPLQQHFRAAAAFEDEASHAHASTATFHETSACSSSRREAAAHRRQSNLTEVASECHNAAYYPALEHAAASICDVEPMAVEYTTSQSARLTVDRLAVNGSWSVLLRSNGRCISLSICAMSPQLDGTTILTVRLPPLPSAGLYFLEIMDIVSDEVILSNSFPLLAVANSVAAEELCRILPTILEPRRTTLMMDLARTLFKQPPQQNDWHNYNSNCWDTMEAEAELILMMLRLQANHCFSMILSAVEAIAPASTATKQLLHAADCMEEGLLSAAVQSKSLLTVETVLSALDNSGVQIDICKPAGNRFSIFSPLHWAAAMGDVSIVRVLLLELDDPQEMWTSLRQGGCTPCELATSSCAELNLTLMLGDPRTALSDGGLHDCQSSATSPVSRAADQDVPAAQSSGANGAYPTAHHDRSLTPLRWSIGGIHIVIIFIVSLLGFLMARGSPQSFIPGLQLSDIL